MLLLSKWGCRRSVINQRQLTPSGFSLISKSLISKSIMEIGNAKVEQSLSSASLMSTATTGENDSDVEAEEKTKTDVKNKGRKRVNPKEKNEEKPSKKAKKQAATKEKNSKEKKKRQPRKQDTTVYPRTEIPRKPRPEETSETKPVSILSWNVNGLRAVLRNNKSAIEKLVSEEKPDILCLQETKLQETHEEEIGDFVPGYKAFYSSSTAKKGYAGTAMLIRQDTLSSDIVELTTGIGVDKHDREGRSIIAKLPWVNIIALYVPNSGMKLERLDYRTKEWDIDLRDCAKKLTESSGNPTIILGDMNVAHCDIDLYNPEAKHIPKTPGCTAQERESFSKFLEEDDYVDLFREMNTDAVGAYTYWSTRAGGRPFNRGLRLDYFCVPRNILKDDEKNSSSVSVEDTFILEKPTVGVSDHCPIGLVLKCKK